MLKLDDALWVPLEPQYCENLVKFKMTDGTL